MDSVLKLEAELAEWAGYEPENVVACSSGTAALHLAMEVAHPSVNYCAMADYNMVACARAAAMAGLKHRFTGIDDRYLLDLQSLAGWREAIIATHVYGRAVDMVRLRELAPHACIVEDLAEAHGVQPHSQTYAACWSFYRNKIVAGEEGGAVAFRYKEHAAHARKLRCLGFTPAHDYTHVPRGHNYRLANCLAELIRESLRRIAENTERRREIELWYSRALTAQQTGKFYRDAPWVYDMRIPRMTALEQVTLVKALQDAGIEARFGFKPMSSLQEFSKQNTLYNYKSYAASREVIYLPLTPTLTRTQVETAAEVVKRTVGHRFV